MKLKLFTLSALIAFLAGCTTPAVKAPVPVQRTSATFPVSKAEVWSLLVSEVGLNYPVRVIEKESGLISTDWISLKAGFNNGNAAQWILPPGGFLATWNGLRMNMKVTAVETEPGKTLITINCHYEAYEDNVTKSWIVAASNGSVENKILTKIETGLTNMPPIPKPDVLTVPSSRTSTPAEALLELKKLLDAGAITQVEYDVKKAALLEKL